MLKTPASLSNYSATYLFQTIGKGGKKNGSSYLQIYDDIGRLNISAKYGHFFVISVCIVLGFFFQYFKRDNVGFCQMHINEFWMLVWVQAKLTIESIYICEHLFPLSTLILIPIPRHKNIYFFYGLCHFVE